MSAQYFILFLFIGCYILTLVIAGIQISTIYLDVEWIDFDGNTEVVNGPRKLAKDDLPKRVPVFLTNYIFRGSHVHSISEGIDKTHICHAQ